MTLYSNQFSILPEIHLKQDVFIQNHPIVFIHISKTGGSSINYFTMALLSQNKLNYIEAHSLCKEESSYNIKKVALVD